MIIKNATAAGGEKINIILKNGFIESVEPYCENSDNYNDSEVIDANGLTALPAFVDLHTHFRTPGFEHKEDIKSGSMAAARGGYTLVTCMANTNPVCSSQSIAESVINKAKEIGLCEINQCVSITKDFDGKSIDHLKSLNKPIKFISDDGKGVQNNLTMWQAMKIAQEKDLIVMSHAEDMDISPIDYRLAENIETARNLHLAEYTNVKLHMCHVSTKQALKHIIEAKENGVNVTCEVTPHHIWFYDSDYRVNPPIREKQDVDYIINAIKQGKVDAIATDHAPHTDEDKLNDSPGMVGLETAFSVCYTKLCVQNGLSILELSKIMSEKPAEISGANKGKLKKGYDADIVLVDTNAQYKVNKNDFAGKSNNTPFNGVNLQGKVITTIKGGKITYNENKG